MPYGASFHMQQCVEKYLKALLVYRDQCFPKTHDLVALNDLCFKMASSARWDMTICNAWPPTRSRSAIRATRSSLKSCGRSWDIARSFRGFARKLLKPLL